MVAKIAVVAILAGAASVEALPGRSPLIQAKDRTQATGRVLIQLDRQANPANYKTSIEKVLNDTGLAGNKHVNVFHQIGVIGVPGTDSTVVNKLRDHGLVALAAESTKRTVSAAQVRKNIDPKLWGLDRLDSRPLAYDGTLTLNGDGEGVDVYVIDTGVYIEHEQIEGRASHYWTAFGTPVDDGKPNPSGTEFIDVDGHGSHCSGTIAGKDTGVAPKARILAVRVLGDDGSGSTESVIGGMLSVLDRKDKTRPAVASMSLGGPRESDIEGLAVDALVADNVVVVIAAGNSNSDACAFTPAFAENAITVGASDIKDHIADFSNWGNCVDVFAPGVNIYSMFTGAPDAYDTMSGTSMAAPHVAGVVAVLLSQFKSMTVPEVKAALYGNASPNLIKGIRACPQTMNLNTYAKFDLSGYVATPNGALTNAQCQAQVEDPASRDSCKFVYNNKCKSKSKLVTDDWCEAVSCDKAYNDICTY